MNTTTFQGWESSYKSYTFLSSQFPSIFPHENRNAGFSTPGLTESAAVLMIKDRSTALSEETEVCRCCSIQVVISSGSPQNFGVGNDALGL